MSSQAAAVRTPGAKRAGSGEYVFDLAQVNHILGGPDYSTANGACVEGDRMIVGLMRMPAGTGAEAHSHPNEQWIYILRRHVQGRGRGQAVRGQGRLGALHPVQRHAFRQGDAGRRRGVLHGARTPRTACTASRPHRGIMKRSVAALLWVSALAAGACGVVSGQPAFAETATWPTKPIRAILPIAPGTGADVISRIVLNQLSVQLAHPIVIENKGGAGGTIGAAMVAKAEPDGYTLLSHSATHVIAPALYTNLSYDTATDFAAVIPLGSVPSALVVSPSKGIKTVQDLVAAGKAKPGTLTYASAGVGSTTHLTAERFLISAGIEAIHVPFRGGGFQPEIVAGRVDFAYSPIATSLPNIHGGNLHAVAVSGPKRASALPDVPTTLEAGFRQLRLRDLGRAVLAGENAARDRRPAARGDAEGAADAGGARPVRAARRRADADDAGRIRRADQARDRHQRRARQGGRD